MKYQKQTNNRRKAAVEWQDALKGGSFISWLTIPHIIGLLLVAAYFLRSSILVILYPTVGPVLTMAGYFLLGVAFLYTAISGRQIATAGMLFILCCLPGAWFSEQSDNSMQKFGGLALLVMVAGPVVQGEKASKLRSGAWTTALFLTVVIGTASCLWWWLRLPVLGLGSFSGVTVHANTLGPLAGLGGIIAVSKSIFSRKQTQIVWLFLAGACCFSCVASAARVSIVAMLVSLAVVVILERRKIQLNLVTVSLLGIVLCWSGYHFVESKEVFSNATGSLQEKGFENTRELLWNARLKEFMDHPYWGVGIGIGEGGEDEGVALDDRGKVNVEPGSSYLAIASMTGLSGITGFGILFLWVGGKWISRYHFLPPRHAALLFGVGVFMALDGVAEGWVLAVGSPLCLIFWIWLGIVLDSVNLPQFPPQKTATRIRSGRQSGIESLAGNNSSLGGQFHE